MKAILKLIRIPNILIVIATMYFVRLFLIKPVLEFYDGPLFFPEVDFMLLVLATVFIMAAGNIINDYFDQDIDIINKPDKMIIGKSISVELARGIYFVLNVVGIVLGIKVAISIDFLQLALIFPLTAYLLYAYSARYKRKAFLGNVVVAALSAFTLFMVWIFEYLSIKNGGVETAYLNSATFVISRIVLGYVFFAFLTSLIREMIKDLEDEDGDAVVGCRTLPILLGTKMVKGLIIAVVLMSIALMLYIQVELWVADLKLIFWYFMLIHPLFLSLIISLIQAKEKEHYHKLSSLTKYIMLIGIASMVFIQFT